MGISQRISEVAKSKTFAGEPDFLALVHIIKRPTAVHYEDAAGQTLLVKHI